MLKLFSINNKHLIYFHYGSLQIIFNNSTEKDRTVTLKANFWKIPCKLRSLYLNWISKTCQMPENFSSENSLYIFFSKSTNWSLKAHIRTSSKWRLEFYNFSKVLKMQKLKLLWTVSAMNRNNLGLLSHSQCKRKDFSEMDNCIESFILLYCLRFYQGWNPTV